MFKTIEVLRLYGEGHGSKLIAKVTGVARNTVKKYQLIFVRSGLLISEAQKLSDAQLSVIVCVEKPTVLPNPQRNERLQGLLPELCQQLRKRWYDQRKSI
ncbi:helix-turn-helix domain-containing protein [Chitinophaga deserti]|uniref:helix-turn-helix domain-containing protein n=1 Tax=Chitinophaga deserti TaxID=2164099 RepID=UPI000D6B126E|nr:helix-turn-helix domain-containing protein [Chitinophaga deserti]